MQENLKCKSITIEIPKQRWQKFELYEKVPANEAMIYILHTVQNNQLEDDTELHQ